MKCCTCVNVPMGSYANQETATLPWSGEPVGIDRCILPEVRRLWALGVRTIESCCGHGIVHGYIAVRRDGDTLMRAEGYRPDSFAAGPLCFVWPPKKDHDA